MEDWKTAFKWFAVLVSAGIVSALAIEFVTGYLQQRAILAARSEIQQVLLAASQSQTRVTSPAIETPPPPSILI